MKITDKQKHKYRRCASRSAEISECLFGRTKTNVFANKKKYNRKKYHIKQENNEK